MFTDTPITDETTSPGQTPEALAASISGGTYAASTPSEPSDWEESHDADTAALGPFTLEDSHRPRDVVGTVPGWAEEAAAEMLTGACQGSEGASVEVSVSVYGPWTAPELSVDWDVSVVGACQGALGQITTEPVHARLAHAPNPQGVQQTCVPALVGPLRWRCRVRRRPNGWWGTEIAKSGPAVSGIRPQF